MTDDDFDKDIEKLINAKDVFRWQKYANESINRDLDRLKFYGRWCFALTIGMYCGFLVLMIGKLFA